MKKTKIHILGSCVTRDALEYKSSESLVLGDYTARTSLASLACKERIDKNILEKITSTFQKRMVAKDMAKSFWNSLVFNEDGVLVVDLVDDRFRLNVFQRGEAHTVSAEYRKACTAKPKSYKLTITKDTKAYQDLWDQGLKRLHGAISASNRVKILVNCVYFVPTGDSGIDKQHDIQGMNIYLQAAYAKLGKVFGTNSLINYPDGALELDIHHKWGHAPFHYTEKTYLHFIHELLDRAV